MSHWNEQVLHAWNEWEDSTEGGPNDPDDFVAWALANKKLAPRPQDLRRILRAQVTDVLRQAMRTDADGITYRAKQCIRTVDEGLQLSLWFDTDKATPNLMQKSTHQKRKAIVDYCYRTKCDVDHFNNAHPEERPIQFVLDFTDDVADLEAEERRKREQDKAA